MQNIRFSGAWLIAGVSLWALGFLFVTGQPFTAEGSRGETVPVQNRRGPSRHPEYANNAERVRSERVGVGGGLDG